MRFALVGVLIARLALGADGGSPVKQEVTHLRDGGYLVPEAAWNDIDAEMKRLQWQVKNPPKQEEIQIPVQGYLIGMAVVATAFLAGGFALGWTTQAQLGKK